jgi:hypothetical protein
MCCLHSGDRAEEVLYRRHKDKRFPGRVWYGSLSSTQISFRDMYQSRLPLVHAKCISFVYVLAFSIAVLEDILERVGAKGV